MKAKPYFLIIVSVLCLILAGCEKKPTGPEEPEEEEHEDVSEGWMTTSPATIKSGETFTISGKFDRLLNEKLENISFSLYWNFNTDKRIHPSDQLTYKIISISKDEIKAILEYDMGYENSLNLNSTVFIDILVNGIKVEFYRHVQGPLSLLFLSKPIFFSVHPSRGGRPGEVISVASEKFQDFDASLVKIRFQGADEWITSFETRNRTESSNSHALFRIPKGAQTGVLDLDVDGHEISQSQHPYKILPSMPPLQQGAWGRRAYFGLGMNYSDDYDEYLRQYHIGESVSAASSFVIGNTAYVVGGRAFGGFFGGDSDPKGLWEYDVEYDIWIPKSAPPGGTISYAVAFVIGEKAYIGTGFDKDGNSTNAFYAYDPKWDTWETKADFPGQKRAYATGFAAGGKGYIGSGRDGNQQYADFYVYDPGSDKWTQLTDIPGKRSEAYAFSLNGQGYVGGGRSDGRYYDLYMYDAGNDAWISKSGIPSYNYTSGNVAIVAGGDAYVGLGYNHQTSPSFLSTLEIFKYSASTDTWQKFSNYADGTSSYLRTHSSGFFVDNTLFIGLGRAIGTDQRFSDFWGYKF